LNRFFNMMISNKFCIFSIIIVFLFMLQSCTFLRQRGEPDSRRESAAMQAAPAKNDTVKLRKPLNEITESDILNMTSEEYKVYEKELRKQKRVQAGQDKEKSFGFVPESKAKREKYSDVTKPVLLYGERDSVFPWQERETRRSDNLIRKMGF